jgi:outer membrane protein OmpA-like peptidoglycan-associated protein
VKKGVAPERLEAIGHGDQTPIEDNNTPKGRAQNRRVEFNIVNE